MNDIPEPTLDLLCRLLGKSVAKRVYRGSLTELFLDDAVPESVKIRLQASRELVRRWLLEDLRRNPVLESPKAVRQYLSVHYASHEREVFCCLFLDNRHRLIALEEMFQGTIDGASVHPREVVKRTLIGTSGPGRCPRNPACVPLQTRSDPSNNSRKQQICVDNWN
jgi:DNA repair protein RadC